MVLLCESIAFLGTDPTRSFFLGTDPTALNKFKDTVFTPSVCSVPLWFL